MTGTTYDHSATRRMHFEPQRAIEALKKVGIPDADKLNFPSHPSPTLLNGMETINGKPIHGLTVPTYMIENPTHQVPRPTKNIAIVIGRADSLDSPDDQKVHVDLGKEKGLDGEGHAYTHHLQAVLIYDLGIGGMIENVRIVSLVPETDRNATVSDFPGQIAKPLAAGKMISIDDKLILPNYDKPTESLKVPLNDPNRNIKIGFGGNRRYDIVYRLNYSMYPSPHASTSPHAALMIREYPPQPTF